MKIIALFFLVSLSLSANECMLIASESAFHQYRDLGGNNRKELVEIIRATKKLSVNDATDCFEAGVHFAIDNQDLLQRNNTILIVNWLFEESFLSRKQGTVSDKTDIETPVQGTSLGQIIPVKRRPAPVTGPNSNGPNWRNQ